MLLNHLSGHFMMEFCIADHNHIFVLRSLYLAKLALNPNLLKIEIENLPQNFDLHSLQQSYYKPPLIDIKNGACG